MKNVMSVLAFLALASSVACGRPEDACGDGEDLETWKATIERPSGGPVRLDGCGTTATFAALGAQDPSYLLRRATLAQGTGGRLAATFETTCRRARVSVAFLDARSGDIAAVIEDLDKGMTKRLTTSHVLSGSVGYLLYAQSDTVCDVTVSRVESAP